MALNKLTDVKLRSARLDIGKTERLLGDGGGLYLRVRVDGKNWIFIGSLRQTRVKIGLGTYPDVSLSEARSDAQRCRELIRQGIDPAKHRAEQVESFKAAANAAASVLTVAKLFELWFGNQAIKRKDGGKEVSRAFDKDVLPTIGAMPAVSIRRADIMQVLDPVLTRGANRIANQLLQMLRQMFTFAVIRELVATDPTIGITKKQVGGAEAVGDRTLSMPEITELAAKLAGSALAPHAEAAIWIMLSTCCRVGEISRARWSDVDLVAGTWKIPEQHSKNGTEHVIHLSTFARAQFEALESVARSKTWVMPGRSSDEHLDTKALQRQFHDRQKTSPLKGRSKEVRSLALSGGPWRSHDLRRTAATLMGELGFRSDVIERCLGHLPDNKLVKVYQRQELLSERRAAFDALGEKLSELAQLAA